MSQLKELINEFDIKLSGDDDEDEFGREGRRHERGMGDDELDMDSGDDELGMDTGDESEFDMDYDDPEHDRGEIDMGGEEGGEDTFAGEKRTDITDKLRSMLQRRSIPGEEGGEEGEMDTDLPSLDDLDLDDEDERGLDDEEEGDPDFDYDAFSDKPSRSPDDDDESVEFDFGKYK